MTGAAFAGPGQHAAATDTAPAIGTEASAPGASAATVLVNDDPEPWREGLHVAAVVAGRGLDPASVATALNGRFVPRASREATPVAPGDRVTLIQPIVGG